MFALNLNKEKQIKAPKSWVVCFKSGVGAPKRKKLGHACQCNQMFNVRLDRSPVISEAISSLAVSGVMPALVTDDSTGNTFYANIQSALNNAMVIQPILRDLASELNRR